MTSSPSVSAPPHSRIVDTLTVPGAPDTTARFDIHPVMSDGEHAVLRYDITLMSAGPADPPSWSTFALSLGGLGDVATDGRGVRLVDTAGGLAYPVARNADGSPASTIEQIDDDTDTLRATATTVFAAPTADAVVVLLPRSGAALAVPVLPAGDAFDDTLAQVGTPAEATTRPLRAVTLSYADDAVTSSQDDQVRVILASDILFASDKHTLTDTARRVVDRAASAVTEQADGGTVHVVGHTDDVDSDAYNQALSERRAASVAGRLTAELGEEYTVTKEGRGESEPVAEGTDDAARAANRRVEIEFTGHLSIADDDVAADIPATDAPTASDGPVELTTSGGTYTVEVTSMVRRPGAIVGTLTARRTSGDAIDPAWFLPSHLRIVGDRNFGTLAEVSGPHNLALLAPTERVLPFDYPGGTTPSGIQRHRLLGDEEVTTIETGETTTVTLVWPDTGQDAVTVDAPDRFRITDIPVTGAAGD